MTYRDRYIVNEGGPVRVPQWIDERPVPEPSFDASELRVVGVGGSNCS